MTDPDPPEIRTVRRSGKRLVYDKKKRAIVTDDRLRQSASEPPGATSPGRSSERLGTDPTPEDEHHCAACGRFFKNFGNAVSMRDGNMHKRCADAYNKGIMSRVEWWEALHATYFAVFQKQAPESMKACVISHAIVDAYLSMETIARSLGPSEDAKGGPS